MKMTGDLEVDDSLASCKRVRRKVDRRDLRSKAADGEKRMEVMGCSRWPF